MENGWCHLTLRVRTVIFAIFHVVVAVLLLFHIRLKSRSNLINAPPFLHTFVMSESNASTWIQSRLTSLYEADAHFHDAFDQTFSSACEVRLNHEVHPLQTFKDDMAARRTAAKQVSVAWSGDVISTNDDKPEQPAIVAGVLLITRALPFRIRASPAQRLTHAHFSAKIEQDANVQGDQRRITSFYYTSTDTTPPIHLAVPRAAQEDSSDGQ